MTEHDDMHSLKLPKRPILRRPGTYLNLAVVAGLVLAAPLLSRWRDGQLAGFGLDAIYYEGTGFSGMVFRRAVEPFIDFSDERDEHFKRSSFSAIWSGTLVLPRSGRYTFATESDDGSWLEIDSQLVVDNGGTHGERQREGVRILHAGPHAIRIKYFQAGMGARMRVFWTPAGRRGPLETIPPTLLFAAPPDRVDLARARAIGPRDLPCVLIFGACLLLAAGVLWRRPLRRALASLAQKRQLRIDLVAVVLLFGAGLAIRSWELSAAGRTWDEDVYWGAGRNFLQNALAGDTRADSWASNSEHPAAAKWLYGPATLVSESFGPARFISALLGALTCALMYLVGRDLASRRVGFVGAGLALAMPHIVAHHKIIGLETPTGLFYMLAVWLFFRGLRQGGNSRAYLGAGLFAGLVVATRFANLSVLMVMLVLYLVAHRHEIRTEKRFPVSFTLGLLPLLAGGIFLLLWPYLWDNPMQHLGEMLSHWEPDRFMEWYLGKKQKPTWYYFPLYFAVTTPELLLAPLLLFFGRALTRRDLGHFTLLLWFLGPFLVMLSPLARDGVRYIFPALPAGCLLMAGGLDWLLTGLARLVRRPALDLPLLSVAGVGLGLFVLHAASTVHPFYLDYYNRLVGGPATVAERHLFEISWWGEGMKDATGFVDRRAPQGARVWVNASPTHVVQLRDDLKRVDSLRQADYIIFNDLFNVMPPAPGFHIVHVVRAAGAPLYYVYERSEILQRSER